MSKPDAIPQEPCPHMPNHSFPQRIALIFGGVSPEHDVSIASATEVAEGLADLACRRPLRIQPVYINSDGRFVWGPAGEGATVPRRATISGVARWELESSVPERDVLRFASALDRLRREATDVAMLILHGEGGEDGRLQGALDLAGIAYTGSGALASGLAMHKPRCQAVLTAAGLPTAPSVTLGPGGMGSPPGPPRPPRGVMDAVGLPCIVKPALGGSSVGISIVREAEALHEAVELAMTVGDEAMVEKYLPGRELTCGVLEIDQSPVALPVTEIIPPEGRFFDYDAKYLPGVSREETPAALDEEMTRHIRMLARRAHLAVGCRGFSRVDFMLSGGEPFVLEINTIPGMTATSLLPQGAAAFGIDFAGLVERMLAAARHD
jgi:D-alanine-D-alanine ligase